MITMILWNIYIYTVSRWRVIGISGSLIRSKTLMELIFNPCGEFRWSPERPLNKIHSPHFHVDVPGIFSDLLRSVQILKRERERGVRKATGSYRTYSIPIKTAVSVPEFEVEDLPSAELQPKFLSLQWRICSLAGHSGDAIRDPQISWVRCS